MYVHFFNLYFISLIKLLQILQMYLATVTNHLRMVSSLVVILIFLEATLVA